jgi:hypothetical protein
MASGSALRGRPGDSWGPGVRCGNNWGTTVDRPVCTSTRKDGQACRAPALPRREACWAHDPAQAEAAREARAWGARKGNRTRALRAGLPRFDNPRGLVKFTGLVLAGVLAGRIAPDVGRTIFYGVNTQRSLLEASDLEKRLEALEAAAQLDAAGRSTRWA